MLSSKKTSDEPEMSLLLPSACLRPPHLSFQHNQAGEGSCNRSIDHEEAFSKTPTILLMVVYTPQVLVEAQAFLRVTLDMLCARGFKVCPLV